MSVKQKEPKFNRQRIIAEELRQCEQTFAFTTRWLAEAEWNGAAAVNREYFLDWRWDANERYHRALRLAAKAKIPQISD